MAENPKDLAMFMAGLAGHYTSFVERSIDRNLELVKSILAKGAFSPAIAKECAERCTAFVDRVVQKNLGVAELLLQHQQQEDNKNDKKSGKRKLVLPLPEEEEEQVQDDDDEQELQENEPSRCERALVYIYKRRDAADNTFSYGDIRADAFYELMGSGDKACVFAATHQLRTKGLIEHLRTDAGKKKRGLFRLTRQGLRRARELLPLVASSDDDEVDAL